MPTRGACWRAPSPGTSVNVGAGTPASANATWAAPRGGGLEIAGLDDRDMAGAESRRIGDRVQAQETGLGGRRVRGAGCGSRRVGGTGGTRRTDPVLPQRDHEVVPVMGDSARVDDRRHRVRLG